MSARPIFRFAPSPNGHLHLGHAYSALLNADLARRFGGRLLLRIEDIDPVRATEALVADLEADLAWLGLAFDGPVRRQSRHLAEYGVAVARLKGQGLLYPCFCSRGEIAVGIARLEACEGRSRPRDPDGVPHYPGTCRALAKAKVAARFAAGAKASWRLDMAAALAGVGDLAWTSFTPDGAETRRAARPERWGDAVVVRKDVPASYHLCVVHDDGLQGVTHVVRGAELEAASDLHVLLARRLGIEPPRYHHHALILGPSGEKLSKSRGSLSLRQMREGGADPATIRAELGFAAAW